MWYVLEYAANFFEAFMFMEFANSAIASSKKHYHGYIKVLFANIIAVSMYIINHTIGVMPYSQMFSPMVVVLLYFLSLKIFYRTKILRSILIASIYMVLLILIDLLITTLITSIFKIEFTLIVSKSVYRLIAVVISKAILLAVIKLYVVSNIKIKNYTKLMYSLILVILLFDILLASTFYFFYSILPYNEAEKHQMFIVFSALIALVLSYFIIIGTEVMLKQYDELVKSTLMNKQYGIQIEYFKQLEIANNKIRTLKHDMNHHISSMEALLAEKKYDILEEYFLRVKGSIPSHVNKLPCPTAINAIIQDKIQLAHNNDIKITADILMPENEHYKIFDICTIIGNALDNAIEACMRGEISRRSEANIEFSIYLFNTYLMINVKNPIFSEIVFKNNRYLTQKKDKEYHGIGLESIRQAVENNSGQMNITTDDGYFQLIVAIPMS